MANRCPHASSVRLVVRGYPVHAQKGAAMQFSTNVYINEPSPTVPKWEVRWFEPNGNGKSRECRRRFDSKDDAYEQAAKATTVLKKIAAGVVDLHSGILLPIDVASARYKEWLLSRGRTAAYSKGRSGIFAFFTKSLGITLCNQISYEVMGRFADHFKNTHDHGRGYCSFIKTFLRRSKKFFNATIDPSALLYGSEGEFAPAILPTRKGAWSDDQINDIIQYIIKPIDMTDLPSSLGKGRGSPEQKMRAIQTRWYRTRMAFLPIFLFLIRYGFRPIDAAAILVRYWNSAQRRLELPPKLNNKRRPRVVSVDTLTARLLDYCARGQDPDAYLFRPEYSRGGGLTRPQWSTESIRSVMGRILTCLNLPGTSYWCRYTALTNLCAHFSGNLKLVADVTGHASPHVLQKYLQTPPDKIGIISNHFDEAQNNSPLVTDIMGFLPHHSDDDTGPPLVLA